MFSPASAWIVSMAMLATIWMLLPTPPEPLSMLLSLILVLAFRRRLR